MCCSMSGVANSTASHKLAVLLRALKNFHSVWENPMDAHKVYFQVMLGLKLPFTVITFMGLLIQLDINR